MLLSLYLLSHSFWSQFKSPHPHSSRPALLAINGVPDSAAWIPCPQNFNARILLLPLLSSSNHAGSPLAHFLASLPKVWGRGGAAVHWLSSLPFYCFGEGLFFFSYQSFSFSPPLTSLIQPRLPLLSRSLSWLHVQQGEKERKRVGGGAAQPQFEGSSLSAQPPVLLLFTRLLGNFLSVHLLCRCVIFDSGRPLCFCLFPFHLQLIFSLHLAL